MSHNQPPVIETRTAVERRETVRLELSRRELLHLMLTSAGATLLRLPLAPAMAAATPVTPTHGFLTAQELAILDAATARIVPTDSRPGARECGVVDYIQSLLSFMPGSDANCDRQVTAADLTAGILATRSASSSCRDGGDVDGNGLIGATDVVAAEAATFEARPVFPGGPFSGRQPQPHFPTGTTGCLACHGVPASHGSAVLGVAAPLTVDNYPPDFFTQFLPLSRLQRLSWKIRILGASAVQEVADNPLATASAEVDLRRKYRDGLAALEAISQQQFGQSYIQLTPAQQTSALDKVDLEFKTLLTNHTIEGMLCVPEYGGNRNRIGWQPYCLDVGK